MKVNKTQNDNDKGRAVYRDIDNGSLFKFVPYAQHIIATYVDAYWKNNKNDLAYIQQEGFFCLDINNIFNDFNKDSAYNGVESLAKYLNVTALTLMNDPKLPFGTLNMDVVPLGNFMVDTNVGRYAPKDSQD